MKNPVNKTCCGCGSCIETCPANCITLKQDDAGFYKAFIDESRCLNCGLCTKNCSFNFSLPKAKPIAAYAAYNRSNAIRHNSSSGGIFASLAKAVLAKGGVVFGAAFDNKMQIKHTCAETEEQLTALQGSKYVQSDIRNTFPRIKALLSTGRLVLFTGTPCQIAGLYTAVGKHENLLTCDLVCHGVPSAGLFHDYLGHLERKYGTITGYNFRSKEHSNARMSYTVKLTANGKHHYLSGDEEPYTMRFISGALQMESCFDCPFTSLSRLGDITLADYWGYEEAHPELADIMGVSLVLVNTLSGKSLLSEAQNLTLVPTTEDLYLKRNNHLIHPGQKHPQRDLLYAYYAQNGFTRSFYNKFFLPKGYRLYILKRRIRGFFNG